MSLGRSIRSFLIRLLFVAAIAVLTFEVISRLGMDYLPPGLLANLPDRIRWGYADERLERPFFRPLRRAEVIDDAELGFRHAPNLNVRLRYPGVTYLETTDANGFANADLSAYIWPDIVVAGDSFSMGALVEPPEAWPRCLTAQTGLRVLNLAASNWDVYQYARVLPRYARDLQPQILLVTLTNHNDFDVRFYQYANYRRTHPDVIGYHDYQDRLASHFQWRDLPDHRYVWFALQNGKEAFRGLLPFTMTTLAYIRQLYAAPRMSEFDFNGRRIAFPFQIDRYVDAPLAFPMMDRVVEDLASIQQFAASEHVPLRFVYLPAPEDMYLPHLAEATPVNEAARVLKQRALAGGFDLDRYVKAWRQAIGPGAELWDATPYLLERAATGEQLTPTSDFHLNARAHQYVAEFIARQLAELQISPRAPASRSAPSAP